MLHDPVIASAVHIGAPQQERLRTIRLDIGLRIQADMRDTAKRVLDTLDAQQQARLRARLAPSSAGAAERLEAALEREGAAADTTVNLRVARPAGSRRVGRRSRLAALPVHGALASPAVRQQLGLTASQEKRIGSAAFAFGNDIAQLHAYVRSVSPDEFIRKKAELDKRCEETVAKACREVEGVLNAGQFRSLKEIEFASAVAQVLLEPALWGGMGVPADKIETLAQLQQEAAANIEQLNRSAANQVLAVLTDRQRDFLRDVLERHDWGAWR